MRASLFLFSAVLALAPAIPAQTAAELTAHRVTITDTDYMGKRGVKIMEDGNVPNAQAWAEVKGVKFHNGEIEVELAGKPATGGAAAGGARGFIGIAFRMQDGKYEYIYLRPTNGRADDQVRRNHSVQYSEYPDFDYAESRKQAPEKYESYADLAPGVWTKYRITVEGTKARLYVNGAEQPCLIVNDLKLGDSTGPVALWIGPGTEGYFSGLKVTAK
jgi:hypothetical protein